MYIDEEDEGYKEVLQTKMHNSLKKLVNKPVDKYDQIDDVDNYEETEVIDEVLDVNELVATRVKTIDQVRTRALDKLKDQAQSMLNRNKKAINALNVDDIVLYKADDVDLGEADAPNIVCLILEKTTQCLDLGTKVEF